MIKYFLIILLGLLPFVPVSGTQQDTVPSYDLKEVEVQSFLPKSAFLTTTPQQILSAARLEQIGALQASDAVKYFSGVQVKDYGGTGGLKTVSIRSLGANHTAVAYDGIPVSDYQTGQIDLGRFPLDHVEMLTLTIGENDRIFQTAQYQSLAGALNIVSQPVLPDRGKKGKIKASLKTGSFGLLNPSLFCGKVLNNAFSLGVSADYLKTEGDYPFSQSIGKDSIAHRRRSNSDVETLKLEANLAGQFGNEGKLLFKVYSYVSDRGLPGAAIYHNDYSGERMVNRDFFTQVNYSQPLGKTVDFQANAKFNFASTAYTNHLLAGSETKSCYDQRDYYLNATVLYRFSRQLSFSWANDGIHGRFNSNQASIKDVVPSRTTWLSAFSAKYEIQSFRATAKILSTVVNNQVRTGKAPTGYRHFSPYIGLSLQPLKTIPVRLRVFYKNTFRMPAFGDMYYSVQPNAGLKPENADQYDMGLTWVTSGGKWAPYISFAGDIYRNHIRNKIVAIPKNSMAVWSVQNYGKVEIQGVDLNATAHVRTGSLFLWKIEGNYTFQNALNKTDPAKETYNKRIPYTSRHSANGIIGLETAWININYHILYCGKRYYGDDNRWESQMKPFTEQGISLNRTLRWKETTVAITAECLNLFDEQYEVVHSYPMTGRSFRLGIKFNY
ncbi:MAG: TonB-dependent receptor [Dysgonamonadaceae bacterium]|nr:TonB-dependent receptor [Dysgonamonadaceae bacterium]